MTVQELAREMVSISGTQLINNVSEGRLDPGGWPPGDRPESQMAQLATRWFFGKDDSLFLRAVGLRSQKWEGSSHQQGAARSWDERDGEVQCSNQGGCGTVFGGVQEEWNRDRTVYKYTFLRRDGATSGRC